MIDEEAVRLGIADQPEAVEASRREIDLLIAVEGAKSMKLSEQTASEVNNERMPTTKRGNPKNIIPPPIADPKSLPPNLKPFEAAAILRCTLGAFDHMVDDLPEGIVRKRSGKPGSKLLTDRDALIAYSNSLPAARKNARGIDLQKGQEKHS